MRVRGKQRAFIVTARRNHQSVITRIDVATRGDVVPSHRSHASCSGTRQHASRIARRSCDEIGIATRQRKLLRMARDNRAWRVAKPAAYDVARCWQIIDRAPRASK